MKLAGAAVGVVLLGALLLGGAARAAGVIENFHFEHVVVEERTYEAVVNVPGFSAANLAGVNLSSDSAIHAFFHPMPVTIQRSEELTDTTYQFESWTEFECTPDCVLIGDLEDWPAVLVAEGTLYVDHYDKLTEMRHITVTVTITAVPTPTPTATLTRTPTQTPTPAGNGSPTATATPSGAGEPTATPTTGTAEPTPSPTVEPTAPAGSSPTATATPGGAATATATVPPGASPTQQATAVAQSSPTPGPPSAGTGTAPTGGGAPLMALAGLLLAAAALALAGRQRREHAQQ